MGIAYSQLNDPLSVTSLSEALTASEELPEPIFSFKLAELGSELMIGGADTSLYTGPITYVPVTTQVRASRLLLPVVPTLGSKLLANRHRRRVRER